jgi:2-keto-3-deoxy-L-rhamnonate aldolase RhmA
MDMNDNANLWVNPQSVDGDAASRLAGNLTGGLGLREKLNRGCALGTFLIEMPTPVVVASLSLAGFDFVVLDMEHSAIGFSQLESLIIAGHASGIAVIVRTWGPEPGLIGKVLDMGAHGVMASHVDSPQRAGEVVEQAKFSPLGRRGFSPITRLDALQRPLAELNEATYVICQIEGASALSQAREIASVPGVDAVFVGPYDLALSMNAPPGSRTVFEAAERIAGTVPKDRALGIYIDDPDECANWAARRFTLQCVSFDGRMFADGVRGTIQRARRALHKVERAGG